jgi:hypothetical protein
MYVTEHARLFVGIVLVRQASLPPDLSQQICWLEY